MEVGVPQKIVTPRGSLDFGGWGASDYLRLSTIAGADSPQVRRDVEALSGRDGGVMGAGFYDPIYPAFTGGVVANTAPIGVTRRQLHDQLRSYLHSLLSTDGTWVWAPSGANLIGNGGFESNVTGWAAVTGGAITRDTSQHQDGVAAAQITMTTSAGSGAQSSQVANQLVAGATYTAQVALKRTVGTGNLTLQAKVYDTTAALLATFTQTIAPTGAFAVYTLTFVAPANADRFELGVVNASGVAQTIYIDAVKVEAGIAATAYVEPGTSGFTSLRQRSCRIHMAPEIQVAHRLDSFQFSLACTDPAAYSNVLHQSADIAVGGAAVSILNAGDSNTYPILRVFGAVTNPTITNALTGEQVKLTSIGAIANGAYVDVDTRLGTVTRNDGTNLLGGADLATSAFFPLYPGAQNISITGSAASGADKLQVFWRDCWQG